MTKQTLQELPINQIHTRENYRKAFSDKTLRELAQSIKENGILEPIIVRPNNSGFEIVAGERRFRAAQIANLVTMPAVIRDVADDDILRLQIVENVQREGVQFMDEAYAIEKLKNDCSLNVAEIAKILGKSDAYCYYMLNLTKMDDDARRIAEKNWISKAVAWHISKLPNHDDQRKAANDLARTKSSKLVTENGAKSYIRDTFQTDSGPKMRKTRIQQEFGNDFVANWKKYLVSFDCEQFERFKAIVRGRTETEVLAEAVDLVMRRDEQA